MTDIERPAGPQEKRTRSRYQEIQELPVPEKVKLALTGDKEARSILMKDSNKQVQQSVMENPRITEMEVLAVANSRTVSDELLRKIADNRQWLKNYQIRVGLVNNPKTPLPIALKLVNTLIGGDLKNLAKSKSVSTVLTQTANRILLKKGS
jgi:hypothetical protein